MASKTIRFDQSVGQPDPERLLYALDGVCSSLDQADIMSATGKEADRVAGLAAAAAVLAAQLLAGHTGRRE